MPLYMDRHYVEGATAKTLALAHEADLAIQEKYRVKFKTYWFDEERSTAFCLIESPDKERIQQAHNEAHGNVPNEILEVDPLVVEAFLGRVKDPTPVSPTDPEVAMDSAFRVIMFTDLKDSTLMASTLGDTKALHLLHVNNALTRTALRNYHGREVKHTGDGIMASFKMVTDALYCAMAIQIAIADHNRRHPDEAIYLRIGLNAGEPIAEDGDFFGKTVQLAARLCAIAQPGQIVVSDAILELCRHTTLPFEELGLVSLKGFDEKVRAYMLPWQVD
jgi:class 3 adenylate cyclase